MGRLQAIMTLTDDLGLKEKIDLLEWLRENVDRDQLNPIDAKEQRIIERQRRFESKLYPPK